MKKTVFLVGSLLVNLFLFGQSDSVTLEFCYRQAEKTFPLSRQMELLKKSNELKVSNLNKNYLPQLNLNGSASLQSDVTQIQLDLPSQFSFITFPEMSKDAYKLTLDVNQSIFDGRVTHYQKLLELYNLDADQKSVQSELYKLKDRINQAYFSIFFLQQTEALLNNTKKQLEIKLGEVHSGVVHGMLLTSAEDGLQAELMKIDQQLTEIRTDRTTAFLILSELTSVNLPETSRLALPDVKISSLAFEDKRLESRLYEVMQSRTGVMKNMVMTRWNPKVYAYGQAGYGRPGFNMLKNDFTPFWIIGARVTWNIWNWNLNKNEKRIYDIQSEIIGTQKETFDKNLRIEAQRNLSEIEKLENLLQKDEEIIALRARITQAASSQFSNGVLTSSEYIARLNEETQARLSSETHRIQLVKAKLAYLFTQGKL